MEIRKDQGSIGLKQKQQTVYFGGEESNELLYLCKCPPPSFWGGGIEHALVTYTLWMDSSTGCSQYVTLCEQEERRHVG